MKPGDTKPTVIDWDDADAEVNVGAVASAGNTWNARNTGDAAAYWSLDGAFATTSQVPTSRTVTTPSGDTEHAVMPATSSYETVKPEDAVALIDTDDDPNATFGGCVNVMF